MKSRRQRKLLEEGWVPSEQQAENEQLKPFSPEQRASGRASLQFGASAKDPSSWWHNVHASESTRSATGWPQTLGATWSEPVEPQHSQHRTSMTPSWQYNALASESMGSGERWPSSCATTPGRTVEIATTRTVDC
jgi:hypothetical protein